MFMAHLWVHTNERTSTMTPVFAESASSKANTGNTIAGESQVKYIPHPEQSSRSCEEFELYLEMLGTNSD